MYAFETWFDENDDIHMTPLLDGEEAEQLVKENNLRHFANLHEFEDYQEAKQCHDYYVERCFLQKDDDYLYEDSLSEQILN